MTTGGEGNKEAKASEPKAESKLRKFFRAFFKYMAVPREPFAMYARDWPYLADDRVAAAREEIRRQGVSIRGLY